MNSKTTQTIVPFSDFKAAHDEIRGDVESSIMRVVKSGRYILGEELSLFEKELSNWLGAGTVVGVGNGTDALALSFIALGVKAGDEIITTDLTAPPTIAAIQQVGAIARLVDIDPLTGLLDTKRIESVITSRTIGIVPVHLYGRSCDMTVIKEIADKNNLWIVEDCAQAIGARHAGQIVGSFGALGTFSFYPTKNLGAYGDAGAVLCREEKLADKIRSLRNCAYPTANLQAGHGMNSRLDEIQAAILRTKLPYLKEWLNRRQEIAAKYQKELPITILPGMHLDGEHVYHLFPVLVSERDDFRNHLASLGVETMVHYSYPMHQHTDGDNNQDILFPISVRWSEEVLSLPLHPHLSEKDVDHVIGAVVEVMEAIQ